MTILLFILATLLKLLLIPSYRSTDFEVHRNWLAVTHSLPIKDWYYDETSPWTLDYPPFFAYFEYALSLIANLVDPNMVDIYQLNYESDRAILFQRISVMITDIILYWGAYRCCRQWKEYEKRAIVIALTVLNAGLFIVDHIHFQYNGMLLGIFLLSISAILEGQILLSALIFSVLLNLKHIFLYVAPVYFVYMLRVYCIYPKEKSIFKIIAWTRLLKLAFIVASVFLVSFGPFIYMGQAHQVISRMFPFKRGLVHSYWAPNIWSLYTFADIFFGFVFNVQGKNTSTLGIVGMTENRIFPNIQPITTTIITLLAMLPALYCLWKKPIPKNFLKAICIVSLTSFMFGWHVHEKAILMSLIPLTLLVESGVFHTKQFIILSFFGNYALHPLIFTPMERFLKLSLLTAYFSLASIFLSSASQSVTKMKRVYFTLQEKALMYLIPVTYIFSEVLHPLFVNPRFEFLPLMCTSVVCAIGILYSYIESYQEMLKTAQVN